MFLLSYINNAKLGFNHKERQLEFKMKKITPGLNIKIKTVQKICKIVVICKH